MAKLRSIQVMRAIAVIAVVCSHVFRDMPGSSGVDLFFVISGFIIARVSHGRSAPSFVKARFWRIYPVYLLVVSPYIWWHLTSGGATVPRVAATLSLWPIWANQYQAPLLPPAWSLYFEVLFYAAVAVWLVSRHAAAILMASLIIVAVLQPGPLTSYIFSPLVLEFAAGYGLARLTKHPLALPTMLIGLALLFCTTTEFAAPTMLDPRQALLRVEIFGLPAAMVVYGAIGLEHWFEGLWAVPLVAIGDASYSIYLTHEMPLHAFGHWSPIAVLLVALVFGLTVHAFLERPLCAWAARRGKRVKWVSLQPLVSTDPTGITAR